MSLTLTTRPSHLELHELAMTSSVAAAPIDLHEQPYPGLRSFRRDETHIFFGREGTINEMVDRLAAHRFLAVTGASGSGKSSLVRTGLLDALERGLLTEAGIDWRIADFRPGNQPLAALTSALAEAIGGTFSADERAVIDARLARGPRGLVEWLNELEFPQETNLLLLVDQFEELFRFRSGEAADERDAFVSLLLESARQRTWRIYVVITMRSDFLGECGRFCGLAEAINDGQFLTPRLTRQQCREAIEGPARVYGQRVEQALVTRMLNDIGSNPDQLPLMQHLLMLMWRDAGIRSRTGSISLTLAHYNALGGIGSGCASHNAAAGDEAPGRSKGALSNHADEILMALSTAQRRLASILFRALVQTEGSVGRDVRRPVALSSVARICAVDPDDLIAIVEAFRAPGRHFLTPSLPARIGPDTVIDITHESLIRQWHKLSDWVRAEFESGETYRHIEKTAQLWKKGKAGLLTMPYLGLALAWRRRERPNAAWAERYGGDFDLAMRFLNASVGRRVLRRRLSAAVIALMVLGSGTFGLVQALAAKKSEKELRMAQDSVNRIKMDLRQARVDLKPNLAEELTDYHVPPQDSLKTDVGTSTPIAVPGATRVATREIYDLVSSDPPPILIDALRSSHIGPIPGAVRIPFAGFPGDWSDQHQRRLKVRLDNLTNGNLDATLVFFCVGTQCWESYNAALRAIHAGYRNVYWYRGGLAAWKEAGLGFQFVFEQAQELKQKFAMPRAIAPRTRWALAASLNEAADALLELSATDGASDAAKAANDELRSLTGALGDNPDFLADLATSEMHLASFLETQDKLDDALKSRWEAKQIWDKLAQKQPQDINWRRASSEAARQIGSNLARQQKHTEALKAYREAQSIDQALAATHPDNAQLQIELWFDLVQIGMSLNVQKRHDDALARLREALAIAQTLATKEPSSDQWIEALSVTHGSMGEVLADSGRPVDALATYREELRIAALFLQQHPKSPRTKAELSRVAQTIGNLAYQLVLEGKFSSALEASELATALMPDVVWMQTNRAHALMFADRIEEARAIYFRYRGQKSQADKLWEDDIRNDFAELRKRGLSHPLMDEIEKQFSIPSATQARQTAEPSAAQTV